MSTKNLSERLVQALASVRHLSRQLAHVLEANEDLRAENAALREELWEQESELQEFRLKFQDRRCRALPGRN